MDNIKDWLKQHSITTLIFILALTGATYVAISLHLIPLTKFEDIAFYNHDTIYQVERFLLNLKSSGIEMLGSGFVDYGSELFFLIPFYKITAALFPNLEPHFLSYQIITVFHLLAFLAGFVALYFLVIREKWSPLLIFSFLGAVLLNVNFLTWSIFIKPDPNWVFMSVAFGLLSYREFIRTNDQKYLFITLLLASFGTCIKWFGFFLLPPVLLDIAKNENRRLPGFPLWWAGSLSTLAVLLLIAINASMYDGLPSYMQQALKILIIFGAVVAITILVLRPKINVLEEKLFARFPKTINAFNLTSFFSFSFLTMNIPLALQPEMISQSVRHFARFFVGAEAMREVVTGKATTTQSVLDATVYGINMATKTGFFSYMVLFILALTLLLYVKSETKTRNQNFLLSFSLTGLVFLFFLIKRKSEPSQAFFYPLFLFSLVQVLKETPHFSRIKKALIFCLLLQGANQAASKKIQDLPQYIEGRQRFPMEVKELKRNISSLLGGEQKTVITCDRSLYYKEFNIKPYFRETCAAQPGFWEGIPGGTYVLLNGPMSLIMENLPNWKEKFKYIDERMFKRFIFSGKLEPYRIVLYQKL